MSRLLLLILLFFSLSVQAIDTGSGVEYIPSGKKLGLGIQSANSELSVNGNISIKENTAPSQTSNYGKIYVDPTTENLFFLDESGNQFDLIPKLSGSVAVNGEWLDLGQELRPNDFSGAQDIVIGGTTLANGDIVLYANGGAVFNQQKNTNQEFRIKARSGKTDYAFLVDHASNGNGNVGLSTANPRSILDIHNGALIIGKYPEATDPSVSSFNLTTWLTNGNTTGDNGDLMARIARPGSSKYFTIIDFDNFNTPVLNGLTLNDLSADRLIKANNGKTLISETSLLMDSGNIGISIASTNEKLTVNGLVALFGAEAPSSSSGYGKLYVKSIDNNLYFMDDSGTEYDLSSAVLGDFEWEDTGSELYPADNSGEEDIIVGNTSKSNADIILETTGSATFNEQGNAVNFQIKGSANANLFFANGSTNNVGIGLSDPSTKLEVNGTITASTINGETINLTNLTTTNISANNLDLNFSNGSIVHSDASASLQENNPQLYWDRQKRQLGLGINSTNEKITINGALALKEITSPSANSLYGKIYTKSTDSNLYFMDTDGNEFDLLDDSISLGINDLSDAKADSSSTYLGNDSGTDDDGTNSNIAVGIQAANGTVSSTSNTAFGFQTLFANDSTVGSNTAIGSQAYKNLIYQSGMSSGYGIALGYKALMNTSNGRNNIALGPQAMLKNISGSYNTIAGFHAANGAASHSFSYNTYLGSESGKITRNGSNNTAIGFQAAYSISNGDDNTILGHMAGYLNTGDENTLIGYKAGDNITSGSNNLIIGYDINAKSASINNQINIANTLFGDSSNGRIGIAVSDLEESLTVNGALSLVELALAPSATNNYGKIYVDSSDHTLYFIDNGGNIYNLADNGNPASIAQWTDTGSLLHPEDSSGEETIVLGGNSIANADIILYNGGAAIFNEQSQNADFTIESGSSENAFKIDGANDQIAISLASPNSKLTVNGALSIREMASSAAFAGYGKLYVDPTTSNLFFLADTGTATDLLQFNSGGAATSEWTDAGTFLHPSDNSGAEDLVFGNDTISNPETVLKADGSAIFNDNLSNADFRIESDNSTAILQVDGSDVVGIKQTNPDGNYELDINGDLRAGNYILSGNYLRLSPSNYIFANKARTEFKVGSTSLYLDNGDNSYLTGSNVNLNDVAYFIESSGNLGIKYNNPNATLTVNGVLSISEEAAPGTTANYGKLYGKSDGKLYFKNDTGTEYDLTCTGSSGEWLDGGTYLYPADASGVQDLAIGANSLASADIVLRANGTAIFNEQSNDQDFTFDSQTQEYFFNLDGSNNNIAISSQNPTEKLSINGRIAFKEVNKPSSSNSQGKIYVDSNTSNLFFLDDSGVAYDLLNNDSNQWSQSPLCYYPKSMNFTTVIIGGETLGTADIILEANGDHTFNEQGNSVNFIVGNNDMFVNGSTGNVGFGLSNPIEALTIDEAWISIDNFATAPSTTANYGKIWFDSSTAHLFYKNDLGTSYDLTSSVSDLSVNALSDAKTTSNYRSIYLGQLAGNGDTGTALICRDNIGVGVNAYKNAGPHSYESVAIGYNSLDRFGNNSSTPHGGNVAIGFESLGYLFANPKLATGNTAIGSRTLEDSFNGRYNAAIGNGALANLTKSHANPNSTADEFNTAVGNEAFSNLTNGTKATALGFAAGSNMKKAHRTLIIGDNNSAPTTNGDFLMDVADLIYQTEQWGGIGINEASPQRAVHVNDVMRIEPQASPPLAYEGKIYVDNSGALCLYMNSNWVRLGGSGVCI